MRSNDTDSLRELIEEALAQTGPGRSALLDRRCTGDAERRRIEHALALAEGGDGFLDRGPFRPGHETEAASDAGAAGRVVGDYRLERRLGVGGMGEVWLADRIEGGFRQQVALKLLHGAHVAEIARFTAEREILGSLKHPGIAQLFGGGVEPDGTAYMVMEYVEGEHLVAWCDARGVGLAQRLALFLDICDAVAFAHTRLVVHRDIKPANILIGADGKAKLLDFGIAKLLGDDAVVDGHPTLHLSAAYAAPEQLSGAPVSTATDVYALGVTLFELLTGRLPWTGDAGALATAVKRLVDAPAPAPSRSATLACVPARALEGDLDAIVSMALRRDPAARHPDARALADDIRRHLAHEPVLARSGARSYVARRFVRRNWKALAAVAMAFFALGIAVVAVAWQAQRARIEAQRAEAIQAFMLDVFRTNTSKQTDPVAARATSARELLDIGAQRIETTTGLAPESRLSLLQTFASLYYDLGLSADEGRLRDQAVASTRTVHGATSTELVEALIDQSSARLGAGSVAAAQAPLDEARTILDARGDAATDLRGRLLMATSEYFQASDLPRAAADADAAVAIFTALPGSRDLLADALYMAGLLDTRVGKIDAAVASLQRAIALSRETSGDPNPKLSILYYQLAESESARLQSVDAEAAARKSIDYALAVNGEDHADTLRARMMLGRVLLEAGRARDSVDIERQVRDKAVRTLGADDNFHVRAVLTISGRAQIAAGDLDAGLVDLRAALAILRAHSPGLLAEALVLEDIGAGLLDLGRTSEALAALDEAAVIRERVHRPADDEQTLLRVRAAIDSGENDRAKSLLAGIDLDEATTPKENVLRLRTRVLEAELDLATGDPVAAGRIADAVRVATASSPSPLLRLLDADVVMLQGAILLRAGSADTACPLLVSAAATRSEFLSQRSPKIAAAERALATCYAATGRTADADRLAARADDIFRQHSSLAARFGANGAAASHSD